MMRTMLAPVFAEDDIDATRHFFTRYEPRVDSWQMFDNRAG